MLFIQGLQILFAVLLAMQVSANSTETKITMSPQQGQKIHTIFRTLCEKIAESLREIKEEYFPKSIASIELYINNEYVEPNEEDDLFNMNFEKFPTFSQLVEIQQQIDTLEEELKRYGVAVLDRQIFELRKELFDLDQRRKKAFEELEKFSLEGLKKCLIRKYFVKFTEKEANQMSQLNGKMDLELNLNQSAFKQFLQIFECQIWLTFSNLNIFHEEYILKVRKLKQKLFLTYRSMFEEIEFSQLEKMETEAIMKMAESTETVINWLKIGVQVIPKPNQELNSKDYNSLQYSSYLREEIHKEMRLMIEKAEIALSNLKLLYKNKEKKDLQVSSDQIWVDSKDLDYMMEKIYEGIILNTQQVKVAHQRLRENKKITDQM